jgi:GNAT superfamily N-acetyltransferase
MADFHLRAMEAPDHTEVAELICASMNVWDILHGAAPGRFTGGPTQTAVFPDVYERLDPGHSVVVEDSGTGRLLGSCFYRARETHVSLGIMNVHPNHFGKGVAKALLEHVLVQEREQKPLRLVSSVMNLESFSLYTKAGFVPRLLYQDLVLHVPEEGFDVRPDGIEHVRDGAADDVDALAELELELTGISRRKDYRFYAANEDGNWGFSVYEDSRGRIGGFLASIGHPAFLELGPGVARDEKVAAALLVRELDRYRGRWPFFLLPVECSELVRLAYRLGARNVEMHAAQVRGESPPFRGVSFPTFMPETG